MTIHETDIIFTDDHKDRMLDCAMKDSRWINHITHDGGEEQPYQFIKFLDTDSVRDESIVEAEKIVTKRIKKPTSIYIMRLPAYTDMHVHIDTYTKPGQSRRTIMMTLLSPRNYKEETRLEYYKEDKKTVTASHIYDDRAVITDPSVFHRCFNQTPEWRYSLQITWDEEVDDIIQRYERLY